MTRVNGAALRILGRTETEVVGHGIERIVGEHPLGHPALRGAAPPSGTSDGRPAVRREWLLAGDGDPMPVELVARRAGPDDAHADGDGLAEGGWRIVFWVAPER